MEGVLIDSFSFSLFERRNYMNVKNITTNWSVGILPALIAGLTVYFITRAYFTDGFNKGVTLE